MAFLLPLLLRLLPALAAAALAWYGWHRVDNWCNGACQSARGEVATLRAQLQAAQERATALALLWSEAINRVEVRYVEMARNRADETRNLRERAGRIRPGTSSVAIRVPVDALGVLHDAERLANDSAAPAVGEGGAQAVPDPAGAPAEAVETTLADWLDFSISAAEAYRDAADKHAACVAAYDSLRSDVGAIMEDTNGPAETGP